ncbi:MAG: hypothetical protein ACTS7D_00665 [Candidatus Hodgkinia cicadicola]
MKDVKVRTEHKCLAGRRVATFVWRSAGDDFNGSLNSDRNISEGGTLRRKLITHGGEGKFNIPRSLRPYLSLITNRLSLRNLYVTLW